MSRVIHEGTPVFVPVALSMEQAAATFWAVQAMFMTTRDRYLAQAMHELAVAIDKKRAEMQDESASQANKLFLDAAEGAQ